MSTTTAAKFSSNLLPAAQLDSQENKQLFKAAEDGDLIGAKKYLKQGANPNFFFRAEDQKNALHISAENKHIGKLKFP
jgi:hypothetical protein